MIKALSWETSWDATSRADRTDGVQPRRRSQRAEKATRSLSLQRSPPVACAGTPPVFPPSPPPATTSPAVPPRPHTSLARQGARIDLAVGVGAAWRPTAPARGQGSQDDRGQGQRDVDGRDQAGDGLAHQRVTSSPMPSTKPPTVTTRTGSPAACQAGRRSPRASFTSWSGTL